MVDYVFILSTYGEHGAEDVVATLDRRNLISMVDVNWPDTNPEWNAEAKTKLAAYLEKPDAALASGIGMRCHVGWGGTQLHVVELNNPPRVTEIPKKKGKS